MPICTQPQCCCHGQQAPDTCDCSRVPTDRAEFKKQNFGATVATIRETDDGLLEVQDMGDGTYSLTVHSRIGETDRFDDMSIRLDRKHFAMLGSIAAR
jgi:hypothetical protein